MQKPSEIIAEMIISQRKQFDLLAAELVAYKTATTNPVKAFTINCKNCPNKKECTLQNDLGFIKGQVFCPIVNSQMYKSVGKPTVAIPNKPKEWAKQLNGFLKENQQ